MTSQYLVHHLTIAFITWPECCNIVKRRILCLIERNVILWSRKGLSLSHRVSTRGIKVDPTKISTIEKLPPLANIKGILSFFGHAGFCQRFIKDVSKIVKPLCNLLEKDAPFVFDDSCSRAFNMIKEKLLLASIMIVPDWKESFEIMCDATDLVVGAILRQKRGKIFRAF